jgi:septum formation topological specificity factor MinE
MQCELVAVLFQCRRMSDDDIKKSSEREDNLGVTDVEVEIPQA